MEEETIYQTLFGYSDRNKVMQHLLENQEIGITVETIRECEGLETRKGQGILRKLTVQGFIRKNGKCGKAALYVLNKRNKHSMFLKDTFNRLMNLELRNKIRGNTL